MSSCTRTEFSGRCTSRRREARIHTPHTLASTHHIAHNHHTGNHRLCRTAPQNLNPDFQSRTMPWTDREIINWLDELLPPTRMAEFEMEVRTNKGLQQRVSAVIRQRDQGGNSIGEIWQRARLSCPSRTDLGNYLLQTLPPDHSDYIEFHLTTIGCRLCQASLADLEEQSSQNTPPDTRRRRFFESSAGLLRPNTSEDQFKSH